MSKSNTKKVGKFTQKNVEALDVSLKDRIIRAAWEDDVSFDSIFMQYGYSEKETIKIMKTVMKPKMFVVWRERVCGRIEKHLKKKLYQNKLNLKNE